MAPPTSTGWSGHTRSGSARFTPGRQTTCGAGAPGMPALSPSAAHGAFRQTACGSRRFMPGRGPVPCSPRPSAWRFLPALGTRLTWRAPGAASKAASAGASACNRGGASGPARGTVCRARPPGRRASWRWRLTPSSRPARGRGGHLSRRSGALRRAGARRRPQGDAFLVGLDEWWRPRTGANPRGLTKDVPGTPSPKIASKKDAQWPANRSVCYFHEGPADRGAHRLARYRPRARLIPHHPPPWGV